MNTKNRMFLNSAAGAVSLIVAMAVAFVLTPLVVHALGDRDYGIWEILVAVVGYMGIFDLGLGPALVRFFAFASARDDTDALNRIFSTAVTALLGAGVVGLLAIGWIAHAPERFLSLEAGGAPGLAVVLGILGVHLLVKFPGTVLSSYFLGVQRHYLVFSLRSVLVVAQAVVIWVALTHWEGSKLVSLAWIQLAVTVLEHSAFLLFLVGGRHGALRFSFSQVSWNTLVELYRFGVRSLLGVVGQQLTKVALPLVVAHAVGIEKVVFYAIAHRLADHALQFVIAMSRPLTPHFSGLVSREDISQIRSDWFRSTRFVQFVTCGAAVGLAFLGEPFVNRWMGPEYGAASAPVILWMALALFAQGLAPAAIPVLVGMARHGRAALLWLGTAALGVALAVPLGHRFGLEGIGAAYATGIAVSALGTMILACRAIGVPVQTHIRLGLGALGIPLALEIAGLVALRIQFGAPVGYPAILVHVGVAGAAYAAAWLTLTLTESDRQILRDTCGSLLRRSS